MKKRERQYLFLKKINRKLANILTEKIREEIDNSIIELMKKIRKQLIFQKL